MRSPKSDLLHASANWQNHLSLRAGRSILLACNFSQTRTKRLERLDQGTRSHKSGLLFDLFAESVDAFAANAQMCGRLIIATESNPAVCIAQIFYRKAAFVIRRIHKADFLTGSNGQPLLADTPQRLCSNGYISRHDFNRYRQTFAAIPQPNHRVRHWTNGSPIAGRVKLMDFNSSRRAL